MVPRKKQLTELQDEVGERIRGAEAQPLPEDVEDREGTFSEDLDIDLDYGFDAQAPVLTANQVVAYNLQRARKARTWTQDDLGERLEKITGRVWSRASVSAAESSWRGGRTRRFDANEVLAFALVFDLPIASFFLPPSGDDLEDAVFVVDSLGDFGIPVVDRRGLTLLTGPAHQPAEARVHVAGELPLNATTIKAVLDEMRKQGLVMKSMGAG